MLQGSGGSEEGPGGERGPGGEGKRERETEGMEEEGRGGERKGGERQGGEGGGKCPWPGEVTRFLQGLRREGQRA